MKVLVGLAAFVVVVAGMRAAAELIVPFLLSVFLAILSTPVLAWLRRRGVPRPLALPVVLIGLTVFALGLGALIGGTINRFVREWPTVYGPRADALADQWNQWIEVRIARHEWLSGLRVDDASALWSGWTDPDAIMERFTDTMRAVGGMLSQGLLILVTAIFLLAEASGLPQKLRLISNDADRRFADLTRIAADVNHYMAIKTWVSVITGIPIAIALWLLGIEYALLWGVLAFLLNYIPNVGSILAAIPAVLLAILQSEGRLGVPITVAGLYLVVNVVIGTLLEPRWMGRGLGMSTLVVFLSLVFWGWVLGPVGMLISVPLTMAVKIALESSDDTRWIAILMGSDTDSAARPSGSR
ncbi:MAG: AI-2E family transporter [Planctomycetaceae bacterium]|nr:AI-2E family transporter [Planctomycetaceae bacterium]